MQILQFTNKTTTRLAANTWKHPEHTQENHQISLINSSFSQNHIHFIVTFQSLWENLNFSSFFFLATQVGFCPQKSR